MTGADRHLDREVRRPENLEEANQEDWDSLELSILELVEFGHDIEYVLDLDLLSYDALVEKTIYVRSSHLQRNVQLDFVASQGDHKAVKKTLAALSPVGSKPETEEDRFQQTWSKKL